MLTTKVSTAKFGGYPSMDWSFPEASVKVSTTSAMAELLRFDCRNSVTTEPQGRVKMDQKLSSTFFMFRFGSCEQCYQQFRKLPLNQSLKAQKQHAIPA
jgi:hypothetical protein